jgi:hypothetical protein
MKGMGAGVVAIVIRASMRLRIISNRKAPPYCTLAAFVRERRIVAVQRGKLRTLTNDFAAGFRGMEIERKRLQFRSVTRNAIGSLR